MHKIFLAILLSTVLFAACTSPRQVHYPAKALTAADVRIQALSDSVLNTTLSYQDYVNSVNALEQFQLTEMPFLLEERYLSIRSLRVALDDEFLHQHGLRSLRSLKENEREALLNTEISSLLQTSLIQAHLKEINYGQTMTTRKAELSIEAGKRKGLLIQFGHLALLWTSTGSLEKHNSCYDMQEKAFKILDKHLANEIRRVMYSAEQLKPENLPTNWPCAYSQ